MKKMKLNSKNCRIIGIVLFLLMMLLSVGVLFIRSNNSESVSALTDKMEITLACFIALAGAFQFSTSLVLSLILEKMTDQGETEVSKTEEGREEEHDQGL